MGGGWLAGLSITVGLPSVVHRGPGHPCVFGVGCLERRECMPLAAHDSHQWDDALRRECYCVSGAEGPSRRYEVDGGKGRGGGQHDKVFLSFVVFDLDLC